MSCITADMQCPCIGVPSRLHLPQQALNLGSARSSRGSAGRCEKGRHELGGRHDGYALEGAEPEEVIVAGDDVVGGSLDCGLKDTVVALIVDDGEHAARQHHNAARFNEVGEPRPSFDDLCELRVGRDATQREEAGCSQARAGHRVLRRGSEQDARATQDRTR